MRKLLLIIIGLISVSVGVIGIFIPGLPTTVFLLIASWAFIRSSDRLYSWLCNHAILGKYIREYNTHKSMKLSTKIYAMSMMWLMISLSTVLALYPRMGWKSILIMGALGLIGTLAIIMVPTRKASVLVENEPQAIN